MGCCCAKRSQVHPHSEGVVGRLKFKKPVKTDPPMTEYDEAFANRKQSIKERFYTVKSGRKFCYFVDGSDPAHIDVSIVVCLHGLMQNKSAWILKEPIPNVCQIAVDRFGHGKSSSVREMGQYLFSDGVPEYAELIDHIYEEMSIPKDKKFFVTGHSMGGSWTLQMAASPLLAPRIIAIAPISSPCDPHHPSVTKEERKKWKVDVDPTSIGKSGCYGSFLRGMVRCGLSLSLPKDNGGDFGMALWYSMAVLHDAGSGKEAFKKDHFASTAILDSFAPGCRSADDGLIDIVRCHGLAWSFDIADINVPCFIYSAESDESVRPPIAESINRIVKNADLIVVEGCGHATISRGYRQILVALVEKKAAKFSLKS